jgi:hypothetical protein
MLVSNVLKADNEACVKVRGNLVTALKNLSAGDIALQLCDLLRKQIGFTFAILEAPIMVSRMDAHAPLKDALDAYDQSEAAIYNIHIYNNIIAGYIYHYYLSLLFTLFFIITNVSNVALLRGGFGHDTWSTPPTQVPWRGIYRGGQEQIGEPARSFGGH